MRPPPLGTVACNSALRVNTPMNVTRLLGNLGLALSLVLSLSSSAADRFDSVYISEFLADNRQVIQDDHGEHHGWIELHNGGAATINLAGWFLSDSKTNLTKWRFPDVALLPDKYLLVFASGKTRSNGLSQLHANFRLEPR